LRSESRLKEEDCPSTLIYHAVIDNPILPATGYLDSGAWLVEIPPTDHIFMGKKEREWCAIVYEDILPGLVVVNK